MPNAVTTLRDSIARQIAKTFGLLPAGDDATEEDPEEYHVLPNRQDRRRAGVKPFRSRMRATPHPLAAAQLGRQRPGAAKVRAQQVERLQAAYSRAVEAGEQWVSPDLEQAERDRRAARSRVRAGRRATRRSR